MHGGHAHSLLPFSSEAGPGTFTGEVTCKATSFFCRPQNRFEQTDPVPFSPPSLLSLVTSYPFVQDYFSNYDSSLKLSTLALSIHLWVDILSGATSQLLATVQFKHRCGGFSVAGLSMPWVCTQRGILGPMVALLLDF